MIATQIIPLQYFKDKGEYGKTIDLWLHLHNLNNNNEHIFVESNVSLYHNLNLPDFTEEILNNPSIIDNDSTKSPSVYPFNSIDISKLHIALEIYNEESLKYFHISITEIEEFQEEDKLACKVFLYVIKITRNDGLEWQVKKRYSQIRALRQSLAENVSNVRIFFCDLN